GPASARPRHPRHPLPGQRPRPRRGLPRGGGPVIRRCELDRVLDAVRGTGVHTELEALLRPTNVGCPRQLGADVLLTGTILTVGHHRAATLVNVHATLTQEIARSAQVAIGTRYRRKGDRES